MIMKKKEILLTAVLAVVIFIGIFALLSLSEKESEGNWVHVTESFENYGEKEIPLGTSQRPDEKS